MVVVKWKERIRKRERMQAELLIGVSGESKSIALHPYSSENKRKWKRMRNMEKEGSVEVEKHGSLVVFSVLARKKHSHLRE